MNLNSFVLIYFLKVRRHLDLKGREFHTRGAAMEKARDLVPINLACLIYGTVNRASPVNAELEHLELGTEVNGEPVELP